MANMKIVHLGKYYPPAPGGIETHVRTLAKAQAELGADVRVFCMNHKPGPTIVEQDGPVEVTRFGRAASAMKLDVCPELPAALRKVEADVLHLQVPNPTMLLALLGVRRHPSLVVTYQSDVVKQRLRGALFRPIERVVYRRVKAILTSSPTYASGSSFLKRYADRMSVLPNGLDLAPYLEPSPEHWAEAKAIRGRYKGPIWLGCGRLVYYKGFHNAIRALTRVEGTLLLVGGGPERSSLEQEARVLGVAERVVFLGNLPHYLDLTPYYLAADAFWFPSNARSEAFGLVQVEAMACGCPVINANIPHSGVSWVSRHDREGLTVPVDDPVALADAANRLIREPGLRDRLALAARSRSMAEFDHRVMAVHSLDVYRRVLAKIASAPASRTSGRPLADVEISPT